MIKRSKFVYVIGSIIIGIISVLFVLTSLILSGVIDTRSYKLVLASGSKQAVYDGGALVCDEWKLIEGELKEGHKVVVTATGSQTTVGSSANGFTVKVVDANGAEVTEDYEVVTQTGMLTVTARPITVQSGLATKEYDGTPLTNEEIDIEDGSLAEGHVMEETVIGSRTDVGESPNEFSVTIYDEAEKDVTANYTITYVFGELEVVPIPVTVKTATRSRVYDGTPLTGSEEDVSVVSNKTFLNGHTATYVMSGAQTDAGESPNSVAEIAVKDADGNDVSFNYEITVQEGKLGVRPCPITIQSTGDKKAYDGYELTNPDFDVLETLVFGHVLSVDVVGSQTMVGESLNTIVESSVKIVDEAEREVTYNYDISFVEGKLIVYDADDPLPEATNPGNIAGGSTPSEEAPDDLVVAKVTSSTDGTIYLRQMSMGDYAMSGAQYGWADVPSSGHYTTLLDNTYSMNYLTGVALKNAGYTIADLDVEIVDDYGYMLPYYLNNGMGAYETQTDDVKFSGSMRTYSVPYIPYDYRTDGALSTLNLGNYASAEAAYYQFVKEKYLDIPSDTETYTYLTQLISDQNWSKTRPNIIKRVAEYVSTAATYNLKYADLVIDGETLDTVEDPIVAFLKTYKEGVCRHYASAATAIYRLLGIPARYTVGFKVDVEAETETEVLAKYGHAWTEVYIEGMGWVCVEVTGSDGNSSGSGGSENGNDGNTDGGNSALKVKLTITAKSHYVQTTDETATLSATNEYVNTTQIANLISKGVFDHITVEITGEQVGIGKSDAILQSVTFWDSDGTDITATVEESYGINKKKGVLHLYMYEMTVATGSASAIYNAQPLQCNESSTEGVQDGHTATVTVRGAQTNAGVSSNTCAVTVKNESGENVTDYYRIAYDYGKLEVFKLEITICAGSAEKPYDGTPLTIASNAFEVQGDNQISTHTVSAKVVGTLVYIGSAQTTIDLETVAVSDENGNDVTKNYTIKCKPGTLKINPAV